jgi:hypothetical protein
MFPHAYLAAAASLQNAALCHYCGRCVLNLWPLGLQDTRMRGWGSGTEDKCRALHIDSERQDSGHQEAELAIRGRARRSSEALGAAQ